jgi:hypothetical protein
MKNPLVREIVLALAIKIAALTVLWFAFFSHPQDKHMPAAKVQAALLGAAAAPAESVNEDQR